MTKLLIDHAVLRDVIEVLSWLDEGTLGSEPPEVVVPRALKAVRAALAQPQADHSLFECDIKPRPLTHPLRDYHAAISEGPLHYTWTDKPHRLVYDLIAAVRYYAQPATQPQAEPALHQTLERVAMYLESWSDDTITSPADAASMVRSAAKLASIK